MAKNMILVTGATGNVGRQVVSQLAQSGRQVRALTRHPGQSGLPTGAEVVHGDLAQPDSVAASLEGVEAVFLMWPLPRLETLPAILDSIRKHASRIVLLSSSAVRDGLAQQETPIGQAHADLENYVQKSGIEWTLLRPGAFAANSLRWWAPQIWAGDVVRWPYAAAAMAPIHERDIAAVAVRALTEKGHAGAKYLLTGPQALTNADQVRTIGEAIERPLRLEEIPAESARQEMFRFMPPVIADVLLEFWAKAVHEPATVTRTVEQVTGAPAHTLREWALDHAAEFRSRAQAA